MDKIWQAAKLRAALLTAAASVAAIAPACAQEQVQTFDIPAQSTASALTEFARQADVQLLFAYEAASQTTSPALVGEYTKDEALRRLLQDSGLTIVSDDGRTIVLRAQEGASADEPALLGGQVVEPREAVAQAEIVIVGTNIRGLYADYQPIQIYDIEDIARTGVFTLEKFVEKLPQNFGTRREYASLFTANNPQFEAVNSIDLRGVGVGTTLTLLNGRRLALASNGQVADVSLIPMSAIERVEVLTDGASAIYGTDAVGGVVNFVLRDSFDGAETRASYGGVTDGNLRQGNISQTFGRSWNGGNAVASLDYYSASALEVDDRSYAAPAGPGYLTPVDQRYSAFATLSQDVGDRVTLNGDFLYSQRDIKTWGTREFALPPGFPLPPGFLDQRLESTNETTQYFVNLGADVEISESLVGSILASYSDIEVDNDSATVFFNQGISNSSTRDTAYSALDITAKLDGDLFELPGGALRFSIGVGILDEEYLSDRTFNNSGGAGGLSGNELGRTTTYAFGEVFAPIVGAEQGIPFIHRLEVSVAARYTDYEDESEPAVVQDFGSDTVPKIGLLWSPLEGLNLRGTYGESFRAPTLTELDPSLGFTQLLPPFITGLGANAVILQGVSPDLDVETSESWTAGFDFRPGGAEGPYLTATYFNIDYKDRIALPPASEVQLNPAAFSDILFHPTSAAQVEQLLRENLPIPPAQNLLGIDTTDLGAAANALFVMPGLLILDGRSRNYADTQIDGFDISVGDHFDTGVGRFDVGAEVTRILAFKERASPASPLTTGTDIPGNPADFRGRFFVTYTNSGFLTSFNVNYVDDYKNPLPTGTVKVDDWTTVDWTTSYEFGGETGLLPGFELTFSIQNVFDEDPPFVAQNSAIGLGFGSAYGFDPTNADPLGRVVVLGLSKTW